MIENNERLMMIEAIKLAVGSTSYIGFPISGVYESAVERLKQYYEETRENAYLEAALLHIHAYMEMGYDYDDKKDLFDYVLSHLGTERSVEFPKLYYVPRKVKLTKGQVRTMIQKWPASKSRMAINDVTDDIISKVKNRDIGIYYYNSNPTPEKPGTTGDLYELVIGEEESYFHDIKRRKYFTFSK